MIKQIKIRNIFGIKEFDVNFERKNVMSGNFVDIEEQMIQVDGSYYSLIPTFLAKNAAGKTSFIKAIDLASSFVTKDGLIDELSTYIVLKINQYAMQRVHNQMRNIENDINTDEMSINFDVSKFINDIPETLFNEVSYKGADEAIIEIKQDDNLFVLILTKNDLTIRINKETVSMKDILFNTIPYLQIDKAVVRHNPWPVSAKFKKECNKYFNDKKINFISNFNVRTLYLDNQKNSGMDNVIKKRSAYRHIMEISRFFGYDALKLLLQKIDDNIQTIVEDPTTKTIEIFLKDSQIPLNPERLSFGTIKVMELISSSIPLFNNGGILMVDEIENGLHLSLIKLIVEMYSTPEINKSKAQLFITTHNPLIIERDIVDVGNVYMSEGHKFVNIRDIKGIGKTYDMISFVKSKNYFNDIFWMEKNTDIRSTLSSPTISRIIDSFIERTNIA